MGSWEVSPSGGGRKSSRGKMAELQNSSQIQSLSTTLLVPPQARRALDLQLPAGPTLAKAGAGWIPSPGTHSSRTVVNVPDRCLSSAQSF